MKPKPKSKRKPFLSLDDAYKIRGDAEKQAWMCDHPGQGYPEHSCGLSDEEAQAFDRWMFHRLFENPALVLPQAAAQ